MTPRSANRCLGGLQLAHFLVESRYWFPVWVIFLQAEAGLSLFAIALADAFFRAVVVLLEFPFGVLGDRLGHRKTYATGVAVLALAYLSVPMIASVSALLLVWFIWAVAIALISGSDTAYAYELLRDAQREPGAAHYFSRLNAVGSASHLLTVLAAGILYELRPDLPFWINAGSALAASLILWALLSPSRGSAVPAGIAVIVREALGWFARNRQLLRYGILQTLLMVALWTPTYILQPFLAEQGIPSRWIAVIFVGAYALGGIYGLGAVRLSRVVGLRQLMLSLPLIMAVATLGIALLPGPWYFLAIFSYAIPFYLGDPILKALINREVDSRARASVLSAISLAASLCMMLSRPLAGVVADHSGAPAGFVVWGGVMVVLAVVCGVGLWRMTWPDVVSHAGSLERPGARRD